ncbi:D-3-phosphoglycerate dehydrogenase [Arachidicoccus ginsenosidimutans]|uniref:phosphoglycerate dehydrogenase n=1 Tax=Arachidicoccus sp. BS20 TaxID=1850526 RepID=UPI0007F0CF58|nr:phosphoglycerate dehydrogenase [Arachidicoccus sp. BS20]ANI88206.1 D-3-phosphoglycerate dehydrogenase [Arachidicoccus sp. BS20]
MKEQTSYPKDKIKILFLENISDKAVERFKAAGYSDVTKLSGALKEDDLVKAIKDVHLLGIRSKTQITPKVLASAQKLQAIGCFCIGTNQVDLEEARHKGITVFNAPYSNTRSVAELVIGSSIMLIRKILDKNKAAHEGTWFKDSHGSYELRGKTLGIIGYGNIGTQLSILAEAFGMKVLFYDVQTKLPLGNAAPVKTLKDLVSKADIVSLHVPETAETEKLVDEKLLKQFKKGSILINYARGHCVDIDALVKYLKSEHLSGAAIDVFPVEPEKIGNPFSSPLQGLPNVLLTPHIGGSTEEAQANIGEDVSKKLFEYLENGVTDGSLTVPALALRPHPNAHRILHIHNNKPGVLSAINAELSKNNINILGQYLSTNDTIGYVVLDIDKMLSDKAFQLLKNVKETIKVRKVY